MCAQIFNNRFSCGYIEGSRYCAGVLFFGNDVIGDVAGSNGAELGGAAARVLSADVDTQLVPKREARRWAFERIPDDRRIGSAVVRSAGIGD